MLQRVELKNFGPIVNLDWSELGSINLVIGSNGSGKTILLKALYTALRTLEAYKRGQENRSATTILAEKLYWTFQEKKLGKLVHRDADRLSLLLKLDGRDFSYSFGSATADTIITLENHLDPRDANSIFLPAKEVLSLYSIIRKSREVDQVFGFDDTYLDLVRALSVTPSQGKNFRQFAKSREQLETMLGGRVYLNEEDQSWYFVQNRRTYPMGVTAEGVKKLALLDTLLGNRHITPQSIVFFDEPETALHPERISKLLDIISLLAECGMQFFLASHSYFVLKKLVLIAREKKISIPLLSLGDGGPIQDDLKRGMPDNPIIDESIRLYEEEFDLA